MLYFDGTPAEAEQMFQLLAYYISQGDTEEVAAKKVFAQSKPSVGSLDAWMEAQDDKEEKEYDIDEEFNPDYDEYDDEDFFDEFGRPRRGKPGSGFAHTTKQIKLGASIELWQKFKLQQQVSLIPAETFRCEQFLNTLEVVSMQTFRQQIIQTEYHLEPTVNILALKKWLPSNAEVIVMDPPLGLDYDVSDLTMILKYLKKTLDLAFIYVWVDSDYIQDLLGAAREAELSYCDTIVVEMVTPKGLPVNFDGPGHLRVNSRMNYVFRTKEVVYRNQIAQQRYKDTGWGPVRPNGKSRGRISMPQVPHEIAEKMLPHKPGSPHRIFAELWPSRMCPRPNWIYIDENR